MTANYRSLANMQKWPWPVTPTERLLYQMKCMELGILAPREELDPTGHLGAQGQSLKNMSEGDARKAKRKFRKLAKKSISSECRDLKSKVKRHSNVMSLKRKAQQDLSYFMKQYHRAGFKSTMVKKMLMVEYIIPILANHKEDDR